MKSKLLSLALVLTVLGMFSFKYAKDETFTVDAQASSINWVGKKVTGQHAGTAKVASGTVIMNGNALKGGSVVVDMTSLDCVENGKQNSGLLRHLKNDDFFSVEKNPTSTFQITKVTASGAGRATISGNLTIKGITKPLSFPATVKKQDNAVVVVAKNVAVNRTQYDIRYGSKSFFNDIGDKAIEDDFMIDFNLVAKK